MPGLVALGRRWAVGGDDFVFPQIWEAGLRLGWAGGLAAVLAVRAQGRQPNECTHGPALDRYVLGLLLIYALLISLNVATAVVSSRGTILNGRPRAALPALLYVRCISILGEAGWNVAGAVWVYQPLVDASAGKASVLVCPTSLLVVIVVTIVVSSLFLFGFLIALWLAFDPLGAHHRHHDVHLSTQKAKRLWKSRLRILLCCANAGDQNTDSFEDIAEILAKFFEDTDLVASDTWAGLLILVSEAQPMTRSLSRREAEAEEVGAMPAWMEDRDMLVRMMELSHGVYGWPNYVCQAPCSPSRQWALCAALRCCRRSALAVTDNCCGCHTAAFRLVSGLHQDDIFHVCFRNSLMETPFVVVAEPRTRSVVVVVRGTQSLSDAVTDLCAVDAALVEEDGGSGGARAHRGIVAAARFVVGVLESENVLADMRTLWPDYGLAVTGHSLGAGVAALVAVLLRPAHPHVRCWAFSPPSLMDKDSIPATREFVLSVVIGDDFIPRLSFKAMQELKRDVIAAIEDCRRPKYDILLRGCFKLLCGKGPVEGLGNAEAPADPVPVPSVSAERMVGRSSQEEPLLPDSVSPRRRRSYTETPEPGTPETGPAEEDTLARGLVSCGPQEAELRLPGRVLHLIPSGDSVNRPKHPTFTPHWTSPERFLHLKLSRWMLHDHIPDKVLAALHSLRQSSAADA